MDHFKTLTANTVTDLAAEVEAKLREYRHEFADAEPKEPVVS